MIVLVIISKIFIMSIIVPLVPSMGAFLHKKTAKKKTNKTKKIFFIYSSIDLNDLQN